ncbi:MAG: adenosylcobinamide-GDP ribazoletransferase [Endomicrobiia bacterium]
MKKVLDLFLNTISFLTIIPIKSKKLEHYGYLLYIFFPAVGLIIGLLCIGILKLLEEFLNSKELVVFFLLFFYIVLADFFHLDGFADTIDALYGFILNKEPKKILKDPHIGAMAVVYLVMILLYKFFILKHIKNLETAILISSVISRWSMSVAGFYGVAMEDSFVGKSFIYRDLKVLIFSLVSAFFLCFIFFANSIFLLFMFFCSYLITFLVVKFFNHKFSGINGDIIGFCSEVVEILILLMFFIGD